LAGAVANRCRLGGVRVHFGSVKCRLSDREDRLAA
jgi:hypothetical protein